MPKNGTAAVRSLHTPMGSICPLCINTTSHPPPPQIRVDLARINGFSIVISINTWLKMLSAISNGLEVTSELLFFLMGYFALGLWFFGGFCLLVFFGFVWFWCQVLFVCLFSMLS